MTVSEVSQWALAISKGERSEEIMSPHVAAQYDAYRQAEARNAVRVLDLDCIPMYTTHLRPKWFSEVPGLYDR